MGYSVIKSFERGIDHRRMLDTTEMGGLLDAKDCHVTRGGEIEKRAAFVNIGTFPANSKGFYATRIETFHVWGTDPAPSGPLPPDTTYYSIPHPDGYPLNSILCVEEFSGLLYVVALYDAPGPKHILHWYGNPPVTVKEYFPTPKPPGGGGTPPTPPTTGLQPGMPRATFKISTTAFWSGTYAPEVPSGLRSSIMWPPGQGPEFDATAIPAPFSVMLTDAYSADWGYPYLLVPPDIPFEPTGSACAIALANAINAYPHTPKVNALVSGNTVTVYIAQVTTDYNNWKFSVDLTGGGDLTTTPANPWALNTVITDEAGNIIDRATMNGGLTPTPATALIRVVDPTPLDAANPQPINVGTFVLAHGQKMYATKDNELWISAQSDATVWNELVFGSDIIDFTMEAEGRPTLVSLADFSGDLAIFADRHIFIWRMDIDPKQNIRRQVLHRTGTRAPHSTCTYGENEVMYLDRSGIRSLRSRASLDAAYAGDVGNFIDDLVQAKTETLTPIQLINNVWCDVEPRSGRLWMAIYDRIFVLSYFPSSQVSAWTYYDASAFPIDAMCASGDNMFWRSGNNFICYGNRTGNQYDATQAYARVPYLDGDKPATAKNWTGIDVAVIGTWSLEVSFDTTQPAALDLIANITKSTYAQQHIPMNGQSPSVSLLAKTTYVGPARIGNAAIHYSDAFAD